LNIGSSGEKESRLTIYKSVGRFLFTAIRPAGWAPETANDNALLPAHAGVTLAPGTTVIRVAGQQQRIVRLDYSRCPFFLPRAPHFASQS
jgi:hypothetical protein